MSHLQDFLGDNTGLGFEIYLFLLQAKDKKQLRFTCFCRCQKLKNVNLCILSFACKRNK